ncbi:MAG: LuxR C-terminal-related transcriptional regulator, partial [Muribaculaceae bacterium]|nr:LuxR C-terminal-related transcriptional regulator [Muribaculaceae bacterium]
AEIARQQADFEWESKLKDHKIVQLEKEQLDKELRHKAQEMANVMISLANKNETLQTVKRELQNIQQMLPKTSSDARKAIQELQGKVTVDIKSDQVLKRVEEEFDLVHNDFIKKLRADYPDLTNNEVLMCAYLKMNLSTKEIAPLLNISVRGVETMRYRIRKKFNLGREDSLTEFLRK